MVGAIPPNPGGGSISRLQITSGLARAGHDVCVVAPITADSLAGGDRTAAAHPEIRVVRYPMSSFHLITNTAPPDDHVNEERDQVASLFPVVVRSFAPDVVVIGRESFAYFVPRLAEEYRLPSVQLLRGSPTDYIVDGRFPADETERLLGEFRRVDWLIAVSRHMADGLRRMGFENVTFIRNGIDTEQFRPGPPSGTLRTELGIEEGATMVLVPAHMNARKRPEDVVRSAELALRQNPNLVYVMAGNGVLRERVELLCAEKGLTEHFRFPGSFDYELMPDLMNTADIIVMASEAEGLARVYLEATACGRLLIASDIAAAREVIEDGVNGLLFRVGDYEHLAARTLEVAADRALRQEVGRRARERAVGWTLEGVIPQYERELERVVGAGEPSSVR